MTGLTYSRNDDAPRRCHAKVAGACEIIAEPRTHALHGPGLDFECFPSEVQQLVVAWFLGHEGILNVLNDDVGNVSKIGDQQCESFQPGDLTFAVVIVGHGEKDQCECHHDEDMQG